MTHAWTRIAKTHRQDQSSAQRRQASIENPNATCDVCGYDLVQRTRDQVTYLRGVV